MRDRVIPVFYDEKSAASTQYSNTLQGIRTAAAHSGVKMLPLSEEAIETLNFNDLPSVAIISSASMPFVISVIRQLRAVNRRVVLAGMDSEQFGHDISCATPSRRAETQQLVNYLYNCGKERIALVGFGRNSINDNFRYHAAMSAVAAWGKPLAETDVWLWQRDPRASFEAFLDVADRYDAVICPNDIMAIFFIDSCKAHGIRVPEDLYVASFGNMNVGRFYRPSVTTMTMDMFAVGKQAFNACRFLTSNEASQETALKITVPSRILVRESTAEKTIGNDPSLMMPTLQEDRFYMNPTISVLVSIENCISQRDRIDFHIMSELMTGNSYEEIADRLYISSSTLRYRLNKMFADADVKTRQEFETLIHRHLGEGNPFADAEELGTPIESEQDGEKESD